MAKKKTKSLNQDPKILRSYDIYSMEKRVHNLDHSPLRSYDLFSLEKRIHDLEMGGAPGPTPSGTYTIELGEPITGTSVTLEKDKHYIFSTVYNGGSFTGAQIVIGRTTSIYVESEIGRACCVIRALQTNVGYSNGGAVSPNKFVPIIIKKNGVDITSFVFGLNEFTSGTSIESAINERYIIVTSDELTEIPGATIEGSFDMGITTGVNDTHIYVIKSDGESITFDNSVYYNRMIGGDIFV